MTDTITLPREVVQFMLQHLEWWNDDEPQEKKAIEALRTALAAESTKQEPVEWMVYTLDGRLCRETADTLRTALAAEQPKPEPVRCNPADYCAARHMNLYTAPPALAAEPTKHPGYIIGSHWLETAYSRICAGEAEADVLRDCGWERVDDALRRDAERYKLVLNWLWRYGLLSREKTRIDTPESFGDWFVLRKPHSIGLSVGYGKTEDAAIDAAMKEDET